ncbi:MAG: 3'(2'),5'-bisphosphate nucleotidase CysQ [Thermonemataceae bacterium]|nr:3'(2'),5'-bisphosphate nucleotidase CysQ [Thermonemataceae bacterium]
MYNPDMILELLEDVGREIMQIYEQDFEVFRKKDLSPITLADQISHQIITEFLHQHTPDIPVISEENDIPAFEERKNWQYFWLLDPLDGTKEFVDKNGEFTINLALIEGTKPIAGFIQVPAISTTYWAELGKGAFKQKGFKKRIQTRQSVPTGQRIAAISRSHLAQEDKEKLEEYQITQTIAMGSALKFCLLAEGKADFYYRYNPTMEWDTAAGQIIVEEAGGKVLDSQGNIFSYNKFSLLNDSFLCTAF